MNGLPTTPCNFCGSQQAEHLLELSDLRLNLPGKWELVRCENCGLLYLHPQPDWAELSRHYPKDYHAYLHKESTLTGSLRRFGMRNRVRSILAKTTIQKGSLLDVGCATGDFIASFKVASGWDVTGLEIVPEAAAAARAKGLQIIEKNLEAAELSAESFDVVTMWDVLEHMPDPAQALRVCLSLLKPGGLLVLKCPDPAGREASIFRESWIGYEAPQHLFGFPKAVLVTKLENIGFDPVTTAYTGSDYPAFFVSFGHWLSTRGRKKLSKFIIGATHKPLGRIIAGILIRPIRWIGIRSSCTYFCQKPRYEELL